MSKTVKKLFEEADISGYFTNHSCRRTGSTRLFQAGVEKKLIKEMSGHRSDAVDAYAVTSEDQRSKMSRILAEKPSNVTATTVKSSNLSEQKVIVDKPTRPLVETKCTCGNSESVNVKNVGMIIDSIMSKLDQKGKTVIKLQIEVTKDN